MPTQWDSTSAHVDPVIGWNSAAFKTAMGGSPTYHVASAGGAAVGLVNALEALATGECSGALIASKMAALDIDSFYGKLKWDANGAIQKPMYMEQGEAGTYVTAATMKAPLSSADCWDTAPAADNTDSTGGKVAGAATMTLSGAILALMSALL